LNLQLDELGKEKALLAARLDDAGHAREEALQERHTVHQENQRLHSNQRLFEEELIKAEAQIELIKDLLLREPAL
jgi:hypothetical protein